jgi:hypothetical protein
MRSRPLPTLGWIAPVLFLTGSGALRDDETNTLQGD